MELNIVNDTTETAYLRFDNGSPVFSLVGTDPNNGANLQIARVWINATALINNRVLIRVISRAGAQ